MQNDTITRRSALKLLPMGLASASIPAAMMADEAAASLPVIKAAEGSTENPGIFKAYDALLAARDELAAAKSELEWLGDEWRHVWPLAPEELFRFPRAESRYGNHAEDAELDLIGRPVMRDIASLPNRWRGLNKQDMTSTCFSLETVERLENWLEHLVTRPPRGKTAKAIARHNASREDTERQLELAKRYEAAKEDVRQRSGVDQIQSRVDAARAAFSDAAVVVSEISVTTLDGLRMKAEALRIRHPQFMNGSSDFDLGGFMFFAKDFLAFAGRADA